MSTYRVPSSTYRVQFNIDFRFLDARDLVGYLHDLGIGDLYSSPRFRARRGSSHGYDVAHPGKINSEIGTEEEFDELCTKLKTYGMGLLLDIVPNHMAAWHENPWWYDVLENGPSSTYSSYFDITWHPATSKAAFLQDNKVLLPILGDLYGRVLDRGEIKLRFDERGFYLRYFEHILPVEPRSYAVILHACLNRCGDLLPEGAEARTRLQKILGEVEQLPEYTTREPEEVAQRRNAKDRIKRELWTLYLDDSAIQQTADLTCIYFDGAVGQPGSFEPMDCLLSMQPYRVAYWKMGYEDINYRRFFDINELVGIRVEDRKVFDARHVRLLELACEGKITGLRIDHIDGLKDPEGYLNWLQEALRNGGPAGNPMNLYVVVEKVLGREETLPETWRCAGTTGYDFLCLLNHLFIDPRGLGHVEAAYRRFTGIRQPFAETCYANNKRAMRELFAGEVNAIGHELGRIAATDREARDLPLADLMAVLVELTACLPVYRTYIRDYRVSERDAGYINDTLELARSRNVGDLVNSAAFDFLRRVLLLDPPDYAADQRDACLDFVAAWQQFSGPVMAKGLEDTTCYVYNSLISRNDVGGDPLRLELPIDRDGFHRFNLQRHKCWPHSMSTTSTHDTKRGEDARARINVLSEEAGEWEGTLQRWSLATAAFRKNVGERTVPTPNEEVLIYQSLLGSWPLEEAELPGYPDRFRNFLLKATREAKVYSSWITPNEEHETALTGFLDGVFADHSPGGFLEQFHEFFQKVAWHGALNSLSQVVLKIAAPGVADFYQGCDLWNFNLVDPDNRRPVDYHRRIWMLEDIRRRQTEDMPGLLSDLMLNWESGQVKLFVTYRGLQFRKANSELFLDGDYVPVVIEGARQECLTTFLRTRAGGRSALVAAPRFTTRLTAPGNPPYGVGAWRDTRMVLPAGARAGWRNVLTDEAVTATPGEDGQLRLELRHVLANFPVALLEEMEG